MDELSLTEFRIALLDYRERAPLFQEMQAIEAKLKRAKFLALVENGFTETQALELCKG